jgi:hypothetical protein
VSGVIDFGSGGEHVRIDTTIPCFRVQTIEGSWTGIYDPEFLTVVIHTDPWTGEIVRPHGGGWISGDIFSAQTRHQELVASLQSRQGYAWTCVQGDTGLGVDPGRVVDALESRWLRTAAPWHPRCRCVEVEVPEFQRMRQRWWQRLLDWRRR